MSLTRRQFAKANAAAIAASVAGIPIATSASNLITDSDASALKWSKAPCRFCGTGCGVMVATSGVRLLAPEAEQAMCEYCAPADVGTPNLPELAVLAGTEPAKDVTEAIAQATDWARRTQTAVIVKTGHLDGASAANIWVAADGHTITVPSTRIDTKRK